MRDRSLPDDRHEADPVRDDVGIVDARARWARISGKEKVDHLLTITGKKDTPPPSELAADRRPQVGDRLPNPERIDIDRGKFVNYLLDPSHPRNEDPKTGGNKTEAWKHLGYDITAGEPRERTADRAIEQLRGHLSDRPPITKAQKTDWGWAVATEAPLVGPNGRHATAVIGWFRKFREQDFQLSTMWLRVHREKGDWS